MKGVYTLAVVVGMMSAVPARGQDALPNGRLHQAIGAPGNLKIGGMVRIRMEAIDGQFRPKAATHDQLLTLRTAVFAEYHTGPFRMGGEVWDTRGYLEEPKSTISTGEVNSLELVQAYLAFDIEHGGSRQTWLQVGRLTMSQGSKRLISRQNFRNTTNAFTGVRLHHRASDGSILEAFYVLPQVRLPTDRDGIRNARVAFDRESTNLQFYGAAWTAPLALTGTTLQLYAYGLSERDSPEVPSTDRHLLTPGVRLFRTPKPGSSDFDVEGIGQTGHARATTAVSDRADLPVRAYYLHMEAGRTFSSGWTPRLAVQFDLGSGNRTLGQINRFDGLYGGRRFDLGPTSLFGAISRSNILAPALRGEIRPDKHTDAFIAVRPVWLQSRTDTFGASGVRDAAGSSGRYVGTQIEARARYLLLPDTQLDIGAARLFKGRFLRNAPNAPSTGDSNYGYVDVTFSF